MDTLEIAAKMVRDAVSAMSVKFSALVKGEINAKVSSLYKPGGTATLATLPALTADNAGYVYDMSEAFITTANFREGAGHKYPAGTNVVVSDVGNGVYKYDVLSGMLDGYVQESRKVGNVPLSADIPVTLTGDTAITVTNTGTASAIGYSIAHDVSGVTAGSKGDTTNQTPGFGGTFKALSATVDAKGHVTSLGDHTVKVPSDTATTSKDGLMSKTDKTKLDAIGVTATNPLEVTKTGETYNVTLKDSGVTAGSKGDTTNQTPGFGGTFKVLSATVDAKGRVTNLAEHSVKTPDVEATQSAKGLMSASDKTKLDTLVDDTLSTTGKAADAKVTGDNVALLKELIQGIDAPIYRKASGNPATFSDADAANVKALSVAITPTQSGSGDPYPPGGGKNLLPLTLNSLKARNLNGTWSGNIYTLNGITFTVETDAGDNVLGITMDGQTTTSEIVFILCNMNFKGGVTYLLSGASSNAANMRITISQIGSDGGRGYTYTPAADDTGRLVHLYADVSSATLSGLTFRPMVRLASDTDPTFAPYSNIRPISGAGSVTVTRTGKNFARIGNATVTRNGVTFTSNNGIITLSGTATALTQVGYPTPALPNGEYILSGCPSGGGYATYDCRLSADWAVNLGNEVTFTLDGTVVVDRVYITIRSGVNTNGLVFKPMIRRADDTDPTFEPYQAQTVTVQLTDGDNPLTVYGGTLDVTTGTLTVAWANIASYNGETLPGRWISDRDVYAAGTSPTAGAQVIYELATPVTYQLTPAQLAALSGYNAVSSDAGSVSVTYKADPVLSLGGGT